MQNQIQYNKKCKTKYKNETQKRNTKIKNKTKYKTNYKYKNKKQIFLLFIFSLSNTFFNS